MIKKKQGVTSVKPSQEWKVWIGARVKMLDNLNLLDHTDPGKVSILEFGCSEGMLLYELKKRGYQVTGNDVCAIANESAKEFGIEISTLPIEEFSKCGRKFDLIMSFHVLEHLHDPLGVMKNLHSMLSPDGMMLMCVPVNEQEWDNLDHFHFFTRESCLKLMESITTDIRSDVSFYEIPGDAAIAMTYVGKKNEKPYEV